MTDAHQVDFQVRTADMRPLPHAATAANPSCAPADPAPSRRASSSLPRPPRAPQSELSDSEFTSEIDSIVNSPAHDGGLGADAVGAAEEECRALTAPAD